MIINNLPGYAYSQNYILVTEDCGSYWFFGAWDDEKKAREVAEKYDCKIIENKKRV